jgi:hypothetical protein
MLLLSSDKFQTILENRFKQRFEEIDAVPGFEECFCLVDPYIDASVYTKLLSMVDVADMQGFVRFFRTCMLKHFSKDVRELEGIKDDVVLQTMCIACMQHYFT